MIRSLDPSAESFLAALRRIGERGERAERAISSGLRLGLASDAPGEVATALKLRSELEITEQSLTNLGRVKTEVNVAEQALQNAVNIVERMIQLGLQAATETQEPAQRAAIGEEVAMAFDRLVAITATRADNRYVFSGDADQVAPYTADPAQPDGVSAYAGSGSTRNMPHPGGGSFRIARTAQDIFDDPGAGVFAAVHALRTALETGPVVDPADPAYHGQYQAQTAAIDAALTGIRAAQEHLNGELSFYGVVQKWVADAIDFSNKLDIRLRSELAQLTEADLATEALELGQATIHRDAAMAARAQHPRSTLFDFLG